MPSYVVEGYVRLIPAVPSFDIVMEALNRHGAHLTGGSLDRSGTRAAISERIKTGSREAAVGAVTGRLRGAEERRQRIDHEIHFSVGPFVAEHVSEFLPDGSLGLTRSWPPAADDG
jgi:hypothetical protein